MLDPCMDVGPAGGDITPKVKLLVGALKRFSQFMKRTCISVSEVRDSGKERSIYNFAGKPCLTASCNATGRVHVAFVSLRCSLLKNVNAFLCPYCPHLFTY